MFLSNNWKLLIRFWCNLARTVEIIIWWLFKLDLWPLDLNVMAVSRVCAWIPIPYDITWFIASVVGIPDGSVIVIVTSTVSSVWPIVLIPNPNRTTTLTLSMVGSCIRYFWISDHWIKDHGIDIPLTSLSSASCWKRHLALFCDVNNWGLVCSFYAIFVVIPMISSTSWRTDDKKSCRL